MPKQLYLEKYTRVGERERELRNKEYLCLTWALIDFGQDRERPFDRKPA